MSTPTDATSATTAWNVSQHWTSFQEWALTTTGQAVIGIVCAFIIAYVTVHIFVPAKPGTPSLIKGKKKEEDKGVLLPLAVDLAGKDPLLEVVDPLKAVDVGGKGVISNEDDELLKEDDEELVDEASVKLTLPDLKSNAPDAAATQIGLFKDDSLDPVQRTIHGVAAIYFTAKHINQEFIPVYKALYELIPGVMSYAGQGHVFFELPKPLQDFFNDKLNPLNSYEERFSKGKMRNTIKGAWTQLRTDIDETFKALGA